MTCKCGCCVGKCTIHIVADFVIPNCDQGVAATFNDCTTLLVGTYVFNTTYGYLYVSSFDSVTHTAWLVNQCTEGNADAGTLVPSCTIFLGAPTIPVHLDCAAVVDCISVEDTNTIDLTFSGGVLSADVKISSDAGNIITANGDGIFAAGGGGSCCCWSQNLCYTVTAPDNLYLFREGPAVSSHTGYYLPYTWSPDAPFAGTLADIPSLVHGADVVNLPGNGCFNVPYNTFYNFYGNTFNVVDYTDPSAPIQTGSHTLMIYGYEDFQAIWVRQSTGILYGIYTDTRNAYAAQRLVTINTSTGVYTDVGGQITGEHIYHMCLGSDLAGQLYAFRSDGNVYTVAADGNGTLASWACAANEFIYAFMGYAGSGLYGVCIYNSNTGLYRNELIDITTGIASDTLASAQRGNFYLPVTPPSSSTKFNRVFSDCGDGVTYTNRDLQTGEEITIPEGATVGECA